MLNRKYDNMKKEMKQKTEQTKQKIEVEIETKMQQTGIENMIEKQNKNKIKIEYNDRPHKNRVTLLRMIKMTQ